MHTPIRASTPVTPALPRFAPYVDVLMFPLYPLAQTARELGIPAYTLAFITGMRTEPCRAAWGGQIAIAQDSRILNFSREMEALRQAGVQIIVSFGGAAGAELATTCDTPEALAEQLQQVADRYQPSRMDFDIEGPALRDRQSIDRRSEAIARVQAAARADGRALEVQFTLPSLTTGLTDDGLYVLQSALAHGVEIALVNLMTMNYGGAAAPDAMGANAISAAHGLLAQLQVLFPHADEAGLWTMIGLTPMIGLNDVRPEVFTLSDAAAVRAFAEARGLGLLAMWSITRDQTCDDGGARVEAGCSGIAQPALAFSRALLGGG